MKRAVRTLWVVLYALFIVVIMAALFYFVTIQNRGIYFEGEIMQGMTFTYGDEITSDMIITWALMSAVAGGMLMMAVYNLALCLFRHGERASLYFSFICIACCVRIAFHTNGVVDYATAISDSLLISVQNVSLCLMALGITCFIFTVFDDGKRKRLFHVLAGVMLALTAILAFVESDPIRTLFAVTLTPTVLGIGMYVVIRSPQFRTQTLPKLYLLSFLFFMFGMLSRALISFELPFIAVSTNFFFMLVHSLLLSDRYARAITAVEKANEELEDKVAERTSELAASERSVREMVANISHDLKTPMSVLSVNLEVALEADASPEVRRHISIAYNKSADLARLVHELLSVGHMETGKTVYNMTWFPLAALLNEAAAKYDDQMEAAGVNLNVSYCQDMRVWIDENHIWKVFDNILGNAQRYTAKGGAVTISSGEMTDGYVTVSISDTGSGIEAEHLPHIFDRYYKADKARGAEGAGLGLYIVKTAVEAMGGSVRAESAADKGTKIIFTLKAEASLAVETAAAMAAENSVL